MTFIGDFGAGSAGIQGRGSRSLPRGVRLALLLPVEAPWRREAELQLRPVPRGVCWRYRTFLKAQGLEGQWPDEVPPALIGSPIQPAALNRRGNLFPTPPSLSFPRDAQFKAARRTDRFPTHPRFPL